MTALVLEDDIERISKFRKCLFNFQTTYVDSAENCIYMLKNNKYDFIALDHDLGGQVFVPTDEKNTGSEVARWINNNYDNFINKESIIAVHSLNLPAAQNMLDLIPNSKHIPFLWLESVFKTNIKLNND